MNVLISKGTNTGTPSNPNQVAEGEIRIFDEAGALVSDVTAAAVSNKLLQIVEGTKAGKANIISKPFKGSDIKSITRRDYVAPQHQVSFVGFNGTSGSIPEVSNGIFSLKFVNVTNGWEPFPRQTYEVTGAATANQFDTALALQKVINNAEANGYNADLLEKHFVWAEVVANEATTELFDDAGTPAAAKINAVEGSKIVTAIVTANADVDASAGDLLRIGHATSVSAGVYIIESIETNPGGGVTTVDITLTTPYGGETGSALPAGSGTKPAASDAAGLKIRSRKYETIFQTGAQEDLSGVLVTPSVTPGEGTGTAAQIKKLEFESFANRSFYETNYFPQTPEQRVNLDATYDTVSIQIANDNDRAVLRENATSGVLIAIKSDGADVADVLALFGTPTNA